MPSVAWEALLNHHHEWPDCCEQGEAHSEEDWAGMPRCITLLGCAQSPSVGVHRSIQGQDEGQWLRSHRSVHRAGDPTEKATRKAATSKIHLGSQRLGLMEATEFRDK